MESQVDAPLLPKSSRQEEDAVTVSVIDGEGSPSQSSGKDEVLEKIKSKTCLNIDTFRIVTGLAYMNAMGVCGVVLVCLGDTIDALATQCGSTSLNIATVFLARGTGATVGAVISGRLYVVFSGNNLMVTTLFAMVLVLGYVPYCNSFWQMHLLFMLLGFGTAVVDTGVQIMSRKAHRNSAGPWLGANTVAFGTAGTFVPIVEIWTNSIEIQYFIMAAFAFSAACFILVVPFLVETPKSFYESVDKKFVASTGKSIFTGRTYYVELTIGAAIFCLCGGNNAISSYIKTYIDDVGSLSSNNESYALAALWGAITVGRAVGIIDQARLKGKTQLYSHLYIWLVFGAAGMGSMLVWNFDSWSTWAGVVVYGFGYGPTVGYLYDLNNRLTLPSETGMSIVMFGLNLGASIVPYLTALAWENTDQAQWLIGMTFGSMVAPIFLIHLTKSLQREEIHIAV